MNLPGTSVPLPVMTDQDRADLLFGIEQQVDFVAASFIRDAGGVREMRAFLDEHGGSHIMFISKIECHEAVENINQMIEASDGIIGARRSRRGSARAQGSPYPEGDHPRVQSRVQAGHHGNPNALDSTIRNPRPTRAEVGDVANAIYDGTDAVMLSGQNGSAGATRCLPCR